MVKYSHTDIGDVYEIDSTFMVSQVIRLKLKKALYKYNKKFTLNLVLSELKSKTLTRKRIGSNEKYDSLVHQFEVIEKKDFLEKNLNRSHASLISNNRRKKSIK